MLSFYIIEKNPLFAVPLILHKYFKTPIGIAAHSTLYYNYHQPTTCTSMSGWVVKVRKQEKGSMSPRGLATDTEYQPPASPV